MDIDHKIADVSETDQAREWRGTFGKEYNMRNEFTPAEVDALNQSKYRVSRTVLNSRFLKDIPRDASILEVGCNLGNQLLLLHQMGFISLHGIDIQSEVVKQAQARLPFANLAEGSGLQIPYAAGQFDLVFTSGVLIHIAPSDLLTAMREIHRCSKTWIWGAEYWAPKMTDVLYRGHRNLLWKTDYSQLYLQNFTDLELVLEEKLRYLNDGNVDTMFLLRRKGP
jgi:pseudaminic acid biosynthesis-associated methylase